MNISVDFQNHWLWHDKPFSKGQAWIDLVLQSEKNQAHTIFRNKVFHLNKDQIITSDNELAFRWDWSRTKIRDYLSLLQTTSMIKIDRDYTKTIITILHQPESEANKQPSSNQQVQDKRQVENTPNIQQNKGIQEVDKQTKIQAEKQVKIQIQSTQKNNSEPKLNSSQSYPIQLDLMDAIEKEKNHETK